MRPSRTPGFEEALFRVVFHYRPIRMTNECPQSNQGTGGVEEQHARMQSNLNKELKAVAWSEIYNTLRAG